MPNSIDFEQRFPEILDYSEDDLQPYTEIRSSSMGYCERQILTGKLGVKQFHEHVKASMQLGTGLHRALQDPEVTTRSMLISAVRVRAPGDVRGAGRRRDHDHRPHRRTGRQWDSL